MMMHMNALAEAQVSGFQSTNTIFHLCLFGLFPIAIRSHPGCTSHALIASFLRHEIYERYDLWRSERQAAGCAQWFDLIDAFLGLGVALLMDDS